MLEYAILSKYTSFKILKFKESFDNFYEMLRKRCTHPTFLQKTECDGFIAAIFKDEIREQKHITHFTMLVLDFDNKNGKISSQADAINLINKNLGDYEYFYYTTSSSRNDSPKLRIIVFIKEAIIKDKYKNATKNFINTFDKIFTSCLDLDATMTFNKSWLLPNKIYADFKINFGSNKGTFLDLNAYFDENYQISNSSEQSLLNYIKSKPLNFSDDEVLEDLTFYKAENLTYSYWLEVLLALHHQYSGSDVGLQIADSWSALDEREGQYKGFEYIKSIYSNLRNDKDIVIKWSKIKMRIINLKKNNFKLPILTRIEPYLFPEPNITLDKEGKQVYKPKLSVNNAQYLFEHYKIYLRFNLISKDIEAVYDDNIITDIERIIAIVSGMFAINGFKTHETRLYISTQAKNNEYNEFKEFVLSKVWDGKDRLEELYNTIIVDDSNIKLRDIYIKHWLLELVKLTCFNEGDVYMFSKSLLVFQCAKYSTQKTEWFNYLFPARYRNRFFHDGAALKLGDTISMSKLECLSVVVCELGEMGQTLRKVDADALKAFISSRQDVLNRKHDRSHQKLRRMTIFCGSTNDYTFLDNKEGNGRFLVLPILRCNAHHNIDMQQVYAQLYIMYEKDGFYMLTDEDLLLKEKVNQGFTYECPFSDKLYDIFDFESEERNNTLTSSEILEVLGYSQEYVARNRKDVSKIKTLCFEANLKFKASTKKFYLPPFKRESEF